MKKNKKGFTLAEILVCMTIMGIIMVAAVGVIRRVSVSYTSLAYYAHKNLEMSVTAMMMGLCSPLPLAA